MYEVWLRPVRVCVWFGSEFERVLGVYLHASQMESVERGTWGNLWPVSLARAVLVFVDVVERLG